MQLEQLFDDYSADCKEISAEEAIKLLHTGERSVWMRSTPAAIVLLLTLVGDKVYEDYGNQYECIVRRYSSDDKFYSTQIKSHE
jgi:hypothetical protein